MKKLITNAAAVARRSWVRMNNCRRVSAGNRNLMTSPGRERSIGRRVEDFFQRSATVRQEMIVQGGMNE
jgi:hypothetical protein